MVLVCAECQCAPDECAKDIKNITQCKNCIKRICCCIDFHQQQMIHIIIISAFLLINYMSFVQLVVNHYNTNVESKTESQQRCHQYHVPPQMNALGASSPIPFEILPVLPVSVRFLDQL